MYRPLTNSEIRQLEQQGCHAESWTRVRVAEGFRPEAVERVRFCGTVELGRFERPVEVEPGLFLPSGLSDAVLADCCVGDDCLVRHVVEDVHGSACGVHRDVISQPFEKMDHDFSLFFSPVGRRETDVRHAPRAGVPCAARSARRRSSVRVRGLPPRSR